MIKIGLLLLNKEIVFYHFPYLSEVKFQNLFTIEYLINKILQFS